MTNYDPLDWIGRGCDVFRSAHAARARPNHGDPWSALGRNKTVAYYRVVRSKAMWEDHFGAGNWSLFGNR